MSTETSGKWVVEPMQGYDTGKFQVVERTGDYSKAIATQRTEPEAHAIARSRENAEIIAEINLKSAEDIEYERIWEKFHQANDAVAQQAARIEALEDMIKQIIAEIKAQNRSFLFSDTTVTKIRAVLSKENGDV